MGKLIQYASSLFVDKFEKVVSAYLVKPVAPILVLSGNIGKHRSLQTGAFLQHCSRNWDSVVYVPGEYELSDGSLPFFNYPNLYYLNRDTSYINGVYFTGTPYLCFNERNWLINEISCLDSIKPDALKVVVTHGIPCLSLLGGPYYDSDAYNKLEPCVDAWISGFSRGAKTHLYDNGVIATFNARGPLDGLNDFDGKLGWSREAFIRIPYRSSR
jgi:hypothetical protein